MKLSPPPMSVIPLAISVRNAGSATPARATPAGTSNAGNVSWRIDRRDLAGP